MVKNQLWYENIGFLQIICSTLFELENHGIHISRHSSDSIAALSRNMTNEEEKKKTEIPSGNYWKSNGAPSTPASLNIRVNKNIYV